MQPGGLFIFSSHYLTERRYIQESEYANPLKQKPEAKRPAAVEPKPLSRLATGFSSALCRPFLSPARSPVAGLEGLGPEV